MTTPSVLIVDDVPGIPPLLSAVCIRNGYQRDSAADRVEAVEKIQSGRFDLGILDLVMPRMNGYEVIEVLRKLPEPPRVIVLTAQGQRQTSTIEPDDMINALADRSPRCLALDLKQLSRETRLGERVIGVRWVYCPAMHEKFTDIASLLIHGDRDLNEGRPARRRRYTARAANRDGIAASAIRFTKSVTYAGSGRPR